MSARKSILRTARLHKERDRAARRQHRPPMDFLHKCAWGWPGWHECDCSACARAREHWARQTIKRCLEAMEGRSPAPPKAPIKVLLADAPDPSVRSIFDAMQGLAFRV